MRTTIKVEKEVEIRTLQVRAGVRYWEDAMVDGIEDKDGDLIPCVVDGCWCPLIDVDKGIIINWTKGFRAEIHYKVCDDGDYYLQDESGNTVIEKSGYVPQMMCPDGSGYGDYIIMTIDENGVISRWTPSLEGFDTEED